MAWNNIKIFAPRRRWNTLFLLTILSFAFLVYITWEGNVKRIVKTATIDPIHINEMIKSTIDRGTTNGSLRFSQEKPDSDFIENVKEPRTFVTDSMEERRSRVTKVCESSINVTRTALVRDVLYSAKHKLYYCPVEKVASTFWRRFMFQLYYTDPIKSPFDVDIIRALRGTGPFHIPPNDRNEQQLSKILNTYTTLLYVRDPHSRIFSAFVDKLIPPNPFYWKLWASPAIIRYRPNHHKGRNQRHVHCGHDVTFSEFVSFVINIASENDGHVKPIYQMCTPCAVNYTIIGKMETFSQDAEVLFNKLNLDTHNLRLNSSKQETTIDAIVDSAKDALSVGWLSASLKCISKKEVLMRLWRKNQIRGFISWRENFELSTHDIQLMNSQRFTDLLIAANRRSTNKNELKIQKVQALKDAFWTLSDEQLAKIEKIYENDFRMFGFEEFPKWLKEIKDGALYKPTNTLDYQNQWDLGSLFPSNS